MFIYALSGITFVAVIFLIYFYMQAQVEKNKSEMALSITSETISNLKSIVDTLATEQKSIIDRLVHHTEISIRNVSEPYKQLVISKDKIIKDQDKQIMELTRTLEEVETFADDDDATIEEIDDDNEPTSFKKAVAVKPSKQTKISEVVPAGRTAAHTAIELHDRLKAVTDVLARYTSDIPEEIVSKLTVALMGSDNAS
jgi:hypothetical protein